MLLHSYRLTLALLVLVLAGCTMTASDGGPPEENSVLAEWTGPYGGVPAFDTVKLTDLESSLEQAMALHLAELDEIAQDPEPATFENTIVAMEDAGRELDRVFVYFGIWNSNRSSEESRAIQRKMAPQLSEYRSRITQNKELFARVKAVYEGGQMQSLGDHEQRLVWLVYNSFARNGAELEGDKAERYAEINARLAELHTQFSNNVLHDEESYVLYLDEAQLGGLSEAFIAAAAAAAKERDHDGKYAITNTRSSMDPFLTFSTERDLREEVWRTYYSRGDNGDEYDNNAIIPETLALRDERVKLLGYENYAQWRLEDRMAKAPENAFELMEAVWPAAVARVHEEVAEMQAIADADGITIEPWDYRYYAEKVRKAKYDLDSDEVKQYMQLDKLMEAMFFVAGELFGFEFTPVPEGSVPVFHEDVVVYEVTRRGSGDHIGLWYLDAYARQGKRSGAWATAYRGYEDFGGRKSNVLSANNSNFIKGAPGEPVLVSWADAETF
jgi:peptidyl-dipeptidase Dcp